MDALILFSHGSLLCGSGEALEKHADGLRKSGKFAPVEVGYLNYGVPTFADAVAKCHEAGVKRIVVLPFFLAPGYFVTNSLPEQIRSVAPDNPEIEFVTAKPIGLDSRLADAIIEAAIHPLGPEEWRDDLTAAARGCRANPDCPIYGTPNCPRAPEPGTPYRLEVE